jgi:hypothetical protein
MAVFGIGNSQSRSASSVTDRRVGADNGSIVLTEGSSANINDPAIVNNLIDAVQTYGLAGLDTIVTLNQQGNDFGRDINANALAFVSDAIAANERQLAGTRGQVAEFAARLQDVATPADPEQAQLLVLGAVVVGVAILGAFTVAARK